MYLLEIGTSFWLISILSKILEPLKKMGTYKNNGNLNFRRALFNQYKINEKLRKQNKFKLKKYQQNSQLKNIKKGIFGQNKFLV